MSSKCFHRLISLAACLIALCSTLFKLDALEDLEENIPDFMLETKQICIPGYPHAFNASIIRWQGSLLLSFRAIMRDKVHKSGDHGDESRIGLIWLDEEFNPMGEPQLLSLTNFWECSHSRSEDARLVSSNGRLYAVFSDNIDEQVSNGGYRMHIAELFYDGNRFWVLSNERLTEFERQKPERREKNWVPFDYYGTLLLAYSLVPHDIFLPLPGIGKCERYALTRGNVQWQWGQPRGGTPGIPIDDTRYLAFFHSSKKMASVHSSGNVIPHYFMGAYTFNREPPFEITAVSPEPVVGRNFYGGPTYPPYWQPVQVVFPCGIIADEEYVWISYGRQDHEIWIAKLDKKKLLQSLVPTR